MAFNPKKFKSLVHYVCRKTGSAPDQLGLTKLHKILWFAEGQNYVVRGEPIVGETYIKKEFGPFSIHLGDVLNELARENLLFRRTVDYHGLRKEELIGKGNPDLTLFHENEIRTIDLIIDQICKDHTASTISDKSHDDIWKMAINDEPLPISLRTVARMAPITEEDMDWAREEIKRIQNG